MKNTKSDAMASIPNHKVLLFGSNLFNGYGSRLGSQSNADIEVIEFPNVSSSYRRLNRLADYNLVVTDYAPFESQKLYTEEQDI